METMYYSAVDESPSYKGGYVVMNKTILDHSCLFNREVNAVVWVYVIIEADGKISNKEIAKSSNFSDIDNEALRLVDFLTEWNPAKSHGKAVSCHWHIPIKFLQNEN
jgi:TonB family protein